MSAITRFIFLSVFFACTYAECPHTIQHPCTCTSTRYEAISIVCDKARSLDDVLRAIGKPPEMIDRLVISSTPIDELPGFVFLGFQIKRLVLRSNRIRIIDPEAFAGTLSETLEELEIADNQLTAIPQTGVNKLRKLKVLSLTDNNIQIVGDNVFLTYYSRATISRLDLSANNISYLHPQAFLGLETLKQLSLDKNELHEIPSLALANVPTLEDLALGVNQIEILEANSLPLPLLKSLSLEVNKIRTIDAEVFETVPSLSYLYLGNNLFTGIQPTMFFYIRQLKVLSLSNNKDITHIALDSFSFLPALFRLEMSSCSLTSIAPGALHKMQKIRVISFAANQLTGISSGTFAALPDLVTLDLSSNAINYVEEYSFSQLPSLTKLDLSSNRLESLPPNILYDSLIPLHPEKQRTLHLHNNPWRCDDNLQWLRKWLRENGDVLTSPPGQQSAKCWTPAHLSGLDLRQTNPVHTRPAEVINSQTHVGMTMRKYVTTPRSIGIPVDNNVYEPPQVSQVNLVAIVLDINALGIAIGLLAICLILLFLIRCFMKNSEEKKEQSSNFGAPSVESAFARTYSGSTMFPEEYRQRSATNANVFLNRPRYWWF